MGKSKSLKDIVDIDWQNHTFSYHLNEDEVGQVYFLELQQSHTDWFRYCCSIAIAQDYHTDDKGITTWTGASDDFINNVLKRFGWQSKTSTRNIYWTHYFSKGSKAKFPCFTETNSIGSDGTKKWSAATLLFNRISGYVFGKPIQKTEGTYKLWQVNFLNIDDDFSEFQQQVLELLDVGIPTPSVMFPKKEFNYFQPIKDVLRVDIPSKGPFKDPVWFRPSGPLAIDFQHHRVHINKGKVAALQEHVLNHKISMLESPAATGKTVLVRSLAFETYEEQNLEIFYFDCGSKRGSSPTELADEIESTEGLFVIENIHLEPQILGPFILHLRNLINRHILFTSRPLFREREYLSPDELKEIHFFPQPKLFEDADNIIDLYLSDALEHPFPLEKCNKIKKITSGNYKMLGYALEGCIEKQGKGEPEKWLEEGVNRELQRLEYIVKGPDGPNRIFPEIVLTLSPLYMNEVLTEESFLRDELHFDKDDFKALDILVELGEITSQRTRDGHVFYGLPHSVQAKAYWKYGRIYRNRRGLKKYKDFVYDYATSGAPNGFDAVLNTGRVAGTQIVKRLDANDMLASAIERQREIIPFARLIKIANDKMIARTKIVEAISHNIEKCDCLQQIGFCFQAIYGSNVEGGQKLWGLFKKRLAVKLNQTDWIEDAAKCISRICSVAPELAEELCGLLDPSQVAARMNQSPALEDIGYYISVIHRYNPENGEKLWELYKEGLALRLTQSDDFWDVAGCIEEIYSVSPNMAEELCGFLDPNVLTVRFDESQILWLAGCCIHAIHRANPEKGKEFWEIYREKLALRLTQTDDFWDVAKCIEGIYSVSPNMAEELCDLLDPDQIAASMNQSQKMMDIGYCIFVIYRSKSEIGQMLWELYRAKIAAALSHTNSFWKAAKCVDTIFSTEPKIAYELISLLDVPILGPLLKVTYETNNRDKYLECIAKANRKVYQQLLKYLNTENKES